LTKEITLTEEAVSVCLEVKVEVEKLAVAMTANTAAVAAMAAALGQVQKHADTDGEILRQILEACTRKGSSETADAIRALGQTVAAMADDVRAVRNALVSPKPIPPA
jgi:hypothetical protein